MTKEAGPEPTGLGAHHSEFRRRAKASGQWTYQHLMQLPPAVDRNRHLVTLVKNRRVLHVGCASEGETKRQAERGTLLFALVEKAAAAQLGIDSDREGMQELAVISPPRHPLQCRRFEDVDDAVFSEFRPDLILLPEVLEHVPDPGQMLRQACRIAVRFHAELVVTVPNALALAAVLGSWTTSDVVHPDHVATYTPRTLQTLLEKSGWRPLGIKPYTWGPAPRPLTWRSKLRLLLNRSVLSPGGLARALVAAEGHRFPDGWIATATAEETTPTS